MQNNIINYTKILNEVNKIKNVTKHKSTVNVEGVLVKSVGLTLEAIGFDAPIGTVCKIQISKEKSVKAVVTGFHDQILYLMPICDIQGLKLGSKVISTDKLISVPVGDQLLGRIIDGAGNFLDQGENITFKEEKCLLGEHINPLLRSAIKKPLDVGIRSINGLLTIGEGQRIGLFAGSGVGKSVLLGMIGRFTEADVIVVSLIGERGREVKEFIEMNLGVAGIKKAVVIASPADHSPVLRYNGALMSMTIAEYFRDKGKKVLLLMDSLTRFAQAQREIALAMGEPPATKGYPPSVFAQLPQLVERAGNGINGNGSITAIFTVLAEGDDQNDPIADAARAILDGHIVLSRKYADLGHYPAIDIEASVSRVMSSVVSNDHLKATRSFKRYHAQYLENQDLVNIGAYAPGANVELDFAIKNIDKFNQYLQQDVNTPVNITNSIDNLLYTISN